MDDEDNFRHSLEEAGQLQLQSELSHKEEEAAAALGEDDEVRV